MKLPLMGDIILREVLDLVLARVQRADGLTGRLLGELKRCNTFLLKAHNNNRQVKLNFLV